MRNKLADLNNHLFAQMERLSDEDLAPEGLSTEINRTKAITSVAREIIATGNLVLKARISLADREIQELPPLLIGAVE